MDLCICFFAVDHSFMKQNILLLTSRIDYLGHTF